jgi:hypothetical protein
VRAIRRHLAAVFGVWLLCHACALATVSIAMCAAMEDAAGLECTCDHSDGTICPMHHRATARSKSTCSCHSTSNPDTAQLASLFGPVAVESPQRAIDAAEPWTATTIAVNASPINSPAVPDPPPPRA